MRDGGMEVGWNGGDGQLEEDVRIQETQNVNLIA